MRPLKVASAEDYALQSAFEDARAKLLQALDATHLEKPLSHWALPKDRRLPYALLDRKLREIVHGSFSDLSSTPGIGRKKLASLVMLLGRALAAESPTVQAPEGTTSAAEAGNCDGLDLRAVSEAVWDEWRGTICRWGLEGEKLGRLASSLRPLPTVIWEKPLREYAALSMDEIRRLRTHGDKRVRVVLEVFGAVHRLLGAAGQPGQFTFRIQPRFVAVLEQWINEELHRDDMPELQDVRQSLVLPLLNQLQLDAGETVHRLVAGRLGLEARPESVREQAERLSVTRARIYQHYEAGARVIALRWPEGKWQMGALLEKLSVLPADDERAVLVRETNGLLFSRPRSPAAEPPVLTPATSEAG
jgi:hypothetical protein